MAVVNLNATGYNDPAKTVPYSPMPHVRSATMTVGSSDSATSTYTFFKIPSNAIILSNSLFESDDLASTGSPTMDIGVKPVITNSAVTADPDLLNDGIDVATAAVSRKLLKNLTKANQQVWELLGLSEDPKEELYLYVTLADAAVNVGGKIHVELMYKLP